MARRLTPPASVVPTEPSPPARTPAALLSIASNSALILLKVVAGALTGSVAILSEAMHSAIDLVASIVAYFSVRKAEEPADEDHRYGHEKVENLAAAIEGILILVGSGVIAFEAVRHLVVGSEVERLGIGIAVIAISMVANLGVSSFIGRRARETDSAALEGDAAHLRTDALTSGGVLIALILVQMTGADWIDPVVALIVAVAIVFSGVRIINRSTRVLVDEALPPEEMAAIHEAVVEFAPRGVVAFHQLRTRRAGAVRYVDLHVQFRSGTTLEAAHATAHDLQDAIRARLRNADVLIHIEPEESVRPGTELPLPVSEG
jgi:cation diffusion facilitator family transporter